MTVPTYNIEYANYNRDQEQRLVWGIEKLNKLLGESLLVQDIEIKVRLEKFQSEGRTQREEVKLELRSTDGIALTEVVGKIYQAVQSHRQELNKEMNELIQLYVQSLEREANKEKESE